jgi:2-polyprenyl-6-methoxyphenol hydroxylase-like FAD-dependent oxidoreductase
MPSRSKSSRGDVAVARFEDGDEIEADVIIGADGIHSRVRAALFGPDHPKFTGKICYRSVVRAAAVEGERFATDNAQWLGPHGTMATALAAEADDPARGLERYERTRRPRESRVVLAARERGLSNHLSSRFAAWKRDIQIAVRRRLGKDSEARGAAWIPEYDATSRDVLVP